MIDAMLCKADLGKFVKHAQTPSQVLWSPKLDGVRTLAVVEATGAVSYWSRAKKAFPNFGCFDEALRTLAASLLGRCVAGYPVVFDGEVVAKDNRFSNVMTQLRRLKDVDNSIFEFHVFDLPSHKGRQDARLLALHAVFEENPVEVVKLLPHRPWPSHIPFSEVGIQTLTESAVRHGFEGLVLKTRQAPYEAKRSSHWCKAKLTDTLDLEVVAVVPGEGKHEGRMGALTCRLPDGTQVNVGTGFTDLDREEMMANMPRLVEVRFQEKTEAGSLRFPAFVRVREDK